MVGFFFGHHAVFLGKRNAFVRVRLVIAVSATLLAFATARAGLSGKLARLVGFFLGHKAVVNGKIDARLLIGRVGAEGFALVIVFAITRPLKIAMLLFHNRLEPLLFHLRRFIGGQ